MITMNCWFRAWRQSGLVTLLCTLGFAALGATFVRPSTAGEPFVIEPAARTRLTQLWNQRSQQGWVFRLDSDPEDPTVRVILFTADRPLLITFRVTVGGEPFGVGWRKLVDETYAAGFPQEKPGDAEEPPQPTWEALFMNARLLKNRLRYLVMQDTPNRQVYLGNLIKTAELSGDGRPQPVEVAAFLAQSFGGPSLSVPPTAYSGQRQRSLRALLDADGDEILSAAEIADAQKRLAMLDRDGNELLDFMELAPTGSVPQRTPVARLLVALDRFTDFAALRDRLRTDYARENLPLAASTGWSRLDADGDGDLTPRELERLRDAEPQLVVAADLAPLESQADAAPATLSVLDRGDGVQGAGNDVAFAGTRLALTIDRFGEDVNNFQRTADNLLTTNDVDQNGYLDAKDAENRPFLRQQMPQWDADGDGKVYREEIIDSYRLAYLPTWSRLAIVARREPSQLIGELDANDDGQLGLREMRSAPERLRKLDLDGDGAVASSELPDSIRLVVARAANTYRVLLPQQRAQNPPEAPSGPPWFQRMDRNGDGDVSPREFFGTPPQFAKLDANDDGLIDAEEADSASSPEVRREP